MNKTKHFATVEQKTNVPLRINAQLKMWYIKRQSNRKTKQKTIQAQRVELLKKDGTTILVTLKTIKKTEQKYRSIYGSLKIKTLTTKQIGKLFTVLAKPKTHKEFAVVAYQKRSRSLKQTEGDNLNKRYELFYSCPHFRKLHFKT